ncbi:MAG: hypothetical protein AMXMBFR33_58960 [Candidatus Xenobia bacterium]
MNCHTIARSSGSIFSAWARPAVPEASNGDSYQKTPAWQAALKGGVRLGVRAVKAGGRGVVRGARFIARLARRQPRVALGVAGALLLAGAIGVVVTRQDPIVPPPPPPISVVVESPSGAQVFESQAAPVQGQLVHTVQPGDTLFRISQRYGVSLQAIASANNLADPNQIVAGSQLVIPQSVIPPPVATAPVDPMASFYQEYRPLASQIESGLGYDGGVLTAVAYYFSAYDGASLVGNNLYDLPADADWTGPVLEGQRRYDGPVGSMVDYTLFRIAAAGVEPGLTGHELLAEMEARGVLSHGQKVVIQALYEIAPS